MTPFDMDLAVRCFFSWLGGVAIALGIALVFYRVKYGRVKRIRAWDNTVYETAATFVSALLLSVLLITFITALVVCWCQIMWIE